MRNSHKIFVGRREGRTHSEDLDIDGRIILNVSKGNRVGGYALDSSG
jgi:hypothetical protein